MMSRLKGVAWFGVVAALVAPYFFDVWWKFLPAIALVVGLTRLASRQYRKLLGIEFTRRELSAAAALFAVTWVAASLLMPYLLSTAGLRLYPVSAGWAFMPFSQAILEELVLRGLLLNGLVVILSRGERFIAGVSAILFVLWHLVFFPFTEGVWLTVPTLVTLALFGYASSLLFLKRRSIALPLALHAGWNLVKFGGFFVDTDTMLNATQAAAFNAVEGSWSVVALALATVVMTEWFFRVRRAD
jgi:membrane protease YdiL (CAAX protease family)